MTDIRKVIYEEIRMSNSSCIEDGENNKVRYTKENENPNIFI